MYESCLPVGSRNYARRARYTETQYDRMGCRLLLADRPTLSISRMSMAMDAVLGGQGLGAAIHSHVVLLDRGRLPLIVS